MITECNELCACAENINVEVIAFWTREVEQLSPYGSVATIEQENSRRLPDSDQRFATEGAFGDASEFFGKKRLIEIYVDGTYGLAIDAGVRHFLLERRPTADHSLVDSEYVAFPVFEQSPLACILDRKMRAGNRQHKVSIVPDSYPDLSGFG